MCLKMHFISLTFCYWLLIWSRSFHPTLQCCLLVLAYMSGDLDAWKEPLGKNDTLMVNVPPFICGMKSFWIKVSFADRLWCSARQRFESKRRLVKRRCIVWETHIEFWRICSLKRIIFSHLNGFLFPSLDIWRMGLWGHFLGMGVRTKGQFVEVCLGKCKVTRSSFFGSTIRMSAYLKNLLLLELSALSFSCSTSLHTREKCTLRTN